jgi:beta-lactamase regulating signal transducer with metallopeptidase domain/predicted hydrocarbon binding protein
MPAITTVWLAGSAVWFLVAAVRIVRFHGLLWHAAPAPAPLRVEAQVLAARLGLPRSPDIDLLPVAVSPMLWGMAGPARLILPADLLERLEPDERSALLAHELIHFRRRDHWVRWLELVALGLYWWYPAAWWARRELHRAEERCCDAGVVSSLPGMALAYAKALIKTLDFLSESRPIMAPSASTVGPVPSLKRRVTMILNQTVPRRPSWPSRLFAVALGLLALPLAPRLLAAQDSGEKPTASAAAARDTDRRTRELERKIEVLERKLDHLAKQLEAKAQRSERLAPRADRKSQREERKEERTTEHEPSKPQGEQRPAEAKPDGDANKAQIECDIEKVIEKAINALGEKIGEAVEQSINTEKLEQIGERIGKAFENGFDPKELEKLGKEIEQSVKESINTEKLEQLGKDIETAVKESIDIKKLEQLIKQIEQSVKESINTEKLEQLGKEIEAKLKTPGEPKEKAGRPAPRPSRREQRALRREERQERDLEQRLGALEEKLDRLLKDSSGGEDEEE